MLKCRLVLPLLCLSVSASVAAAELSAEQLRQLQAANGGSFGAGADMSALPLAAPVKKPTLQNPVTQRIGQAPELRRTAEPSVAEQRPPREVSAQEKQISAMAGQDIRYFGYELFERPASNAGDLPMADDYLLGPGDSVNVRIWGQLDADLGLTVDQAGKLYVPKVGTVNVVGLPFSRLEGALRSAVARVYRNFDLAVSSGDLKTLSITVVGQARQPGVYALSSQGTVINALMAAGGPDVYGSLRQIKLKRRSGEIQIIDLYALLLTGDKVGDYRLQAGDVIHVPKAGPRVAVTGAVVRPAIYELLKGVNLNEALSMAAGFSTNADTRRLMLDRTQPNLGRLAEEVTPQALSSLTVQDGDLLQVPESALRYDQSVSLRGHVSQARSLAWRDGMRISDLIDSPDMLRTPAFWQRLSGQKTESERELAQESESGIGSQQKAQQKTKTLDPLASSRQRDDINWDYATIERLEPKTLGTELISFNLRRAIMDKLESDNKLLQAGDIVTLYSANDIAIPKDKRPRYVRITGEVAEPGVYKVAANETLTDLIMRVGGLSPNAYLFGAQFAREEVRARQLIALQTFVERQEKMLEQAAALQTSAALDKEEAARVAAQLEAQKVTLQKMKQQQPDGRVVLGLAAGTRDLDDLPDLLLDDGDSINIPALPSTVAVRGEVFSPGDYLVNARTLGSYLSRAGGETDSGDLREAFVLRADGSVVARKQDAYLLGLVNTFGLNKAMPGDTLVVPPKLERIPFLRNLRDISQVFSQFGLGAAAIQSLGN